MTQPDSSLSIIRGACPHDCPDTCAWEVTVEDGRAIEMVGDATHPFTRGGLCAKVNHYLERTYSSDRLLYPMRRVGPKGENRFERVGWDEALRDVSVRLQQIIDEDGPTAILPYSYLGTQGMLQGDSMDRRFFARLGATRLERTICGRAGASGLAATLGSGIGVLPEDIVHSRFIVLWGTNTIVTNLHQWPFISQARESGAKIVVIDPSETRTATEADWHIRPLPGTDTALALGMMRVIVEEGLHDKEYIEQHTLGFDRLQERLGEYPPERAGELTGLDADEVVEFARAYATTRPSLIRPLLGMEHHGNGAMIFRSIACLPALVGAWRDLGGGLFRATSEYFFEALNRDRLPMPELEDQTIRRVNMAQLGQALTDSQLDPLIRSLVVYNSNPAAITPNQNRVLEGLAREDLFTVVVEHFMTDTARYADFVFPATTQIEHWDLLWAWGHTYLTLNKPAIRPLGESKPNTEFFRELADRMGFDEPYFQDSDEDMIRTALDSDHPYLKGITFDRLLEDGWAKLDLPRPWLPFAEGGYPTPSGKCEFYNERLIVQGVDPLPAYIPPPESPAGSPALAARYPLMLITAKSALHFLNSTYANLPRHLRAEQEPRLDMHPEDAVPRGIRDGDEVSVYNDRGKVQINARVASRIRPGVVSMPSGWWASLSPGGSSANALTPDGLSDMGGGGDFHDALVEVGRAEQ